MDRFNYWYKRVLTHDFIYKQLPKNSHEIPKMKKIILKSSFNAVTDDIKNIVFSYTILKIISNQKPKICLSKKSISSFKLQKNTPLGSKVTLRKTQKNILLNLFITIVLSRIQNFPLFKVTQQGVLNIGISQLLLFPQLTDKFEQIPQGLGLTITFDNNGIRSNNLKILLSGFQLPVS
uniref:Ribosomal protein L5 n=1 Tax=Proteomonas sulcata TaxID=77928 RepID=A0A2P1G8A8_9CRYP|nr:ribosomal protein L5 [Proteomonas sulcata]AVM81197.1 ribosomal protein L5 [Proteomonas sulcata]